MSLLFNAATEEIDYGGPAAAIGDDDAFTLLFWIYPTTISATFRQIAGNESESTTDQRIATSDGSGVGRFRGLANHTGDDADAISPTNTLVVNSWNFIGFRFDGSDGTQEMRLYHGDLTTLVTELSSYASTANSTGTIRVSAGPMVIGHEDDSNNFPYEGRIGTIAIWPGTALTEGEIKLHQFNTVPKVAGCEVYSLCGWTGTTTQEDWSGQDNAGTITGATIADHVPLGAPFGFDLPAPFVAGAANPKGPLGMPLLGALGGPI